MAKEGWKQADIAEMFNLSTAYVSQLIGGTRGPSPVAADEKVTPPADAEEEPSPPPIRDARNVDEGRIRAIRWMRSDGASLAEIAATVGVSLATVRTILSRFPHG